MSLGRVRKADAGLKATQGGHHRRHPCSWLWGRPGPAPRDSLAQSGAGMTGAGSAAWDRVLDLHSSPVDPPGCLSGGRAETGSWRGPGGDGCWSTGQGEVLGAASPAQLRPWSAGAWLYQLGAQRLC